jgi:ABC-2 type transport system ATP-binding protein
MLVMENVSYAFRGGSGVTDLNFEVAVGEIVALVGLNGAGKTTLMRLALGMLRPQSGTIRVFDHPLHEVPSAQWSQVGALIERPAAYPELTVRENLRIASLLRGEDPGIVEASLKVWGTRLGGHTPLSALILR